MAISISKDGEVHISKHEEDWHLCSMKLPWTTAFLLATTAIGIHAKAAKGGIAKRLCSGVTIEDFSDRRRQKRSPGQIPNKFRPSFDDKLTGGGLIGKKVPIV